MYTPCDFSHLKNTEIKPFVIFDLDETLIGGDSASLWNHFLVEKGIAPQTLIYEEKMLMQEYSEGNMDMNSYMESSISPIIGKSQNEVNLLVSEFIYEKIAPIVYQDALGRISWHQKHRHTVVIVSATGEHLVKPIAKFFNIQHALGIQLVLKDGIYTGETDGILSYKKGKVTRIKNWIKQKNIKFSESYGYSDSCNDIPLLTFVDNAFAINPDPHLTLHAQENNWQILSWN